jgi:hypothetical protein
LDFNEKKRQRLPNKNNLKDRISYLNDIDYQKCKSNEVKDNEYKKKCINEEIKVDNSINRNENEENDINRDSLENNEKIDINNEKDEIGLNISQSKNFKINKNKSLGKNKTIDINNNKIIDDFLSDKNITNKNDEFLFDTNNNHNKKI